MDVGGVEAIILTNRKGEVLYERFTYPFSDIERGELRKTLWSMVYPVLITGQLRDGKEHLGRCNGSNVAWVTLDEVVMIGMGNGGFRALEIVLLLRSLFGAIQVATGQKPGNFKQSVLLDKYSAVCLAIDDVLVTGRSEAYSKKEMKETLSMQHLGDTKAKK